MSTDASYPITSPSPSLPAPSAPASGPADPILPGADFLGFGLLRPFQRDTKGDFANAGGQRLLASAIGQILGTRCSSEFTTGELPWRTEFGSLLYLLRHRPNDETTREIARTYVADAIARWEPRVRVTRVRVVSEDVPGQGRVAVAIRVHYKVVSEPGASNQVFLPGLEVEVPLG